MEQLTPEKESQFKRLFHSLNTATKPDKKKAITNIYELVTIETKHAQQILIQFHSELLQAFSDQVDTVREYSILSMIHLLKNSTDISSILSYCISILMERTNCQDLEGIANLPEVMRPPPTQKPRVFLQLVEPTEEIRAHLCTFIEELLQNADDNVYNYLEEFVNIIRTLTMDISPQVQVRACEVLSMFCQMHHKMLLHFTETLARSILLPMISKKSKIRIAALEALNSVLLCGIWKYNAIVFEILTGFRDPNMVPIKDFYEPSHNINYLATFIVDPKETVREMFLRSIGEWLLQLEDKWDHQARLVPYLLSGLFDDSSNIQQIAYQIVEEVGLLFEKEKEIELREARQYAIDSDWTQNGQLVNLPLPNPFLKRPRLGSRLFIRSHVRKFWNALYKELQDPLEITKVRAAKLLKMGVIYSEDYLTQFLDHLIPNTINYLIREPPLEEMTFNVQEAFRFLGRFCEFPTFLPLIQHGLKGDLRTNEHYILCNIKALECLIVGQFETVLDNKPNQKHLQFLDSCLILIGEVIVSQISLSNLKECKSLVTQVLKIMNKFNQNDLVANILESNIDCINKFVMMTVYIDVFQTSIIFNHPIDSNLDILKKIENHVILNDFNKIQKQMNVIEFYTKEIQIKQDISFSDESFKVFFSTFFYIHKFYPDILLQFKEKLFSQVKVINQTTLIELYDFNCKLSQLVLNSKPDIDILHFVLLCLTTSLRTFADSNDTYVPKQSDILINNILKIYSILAKETKSMKIIHNMNPKLVAELLVLPCQIQSKYQKKSNAPTVAIIVEILTKWISFLKSETLEIKNITFFQYGKNYSYDYSIPFVIHYLFDQIDLCNTPQTQIMKLSIIKLISNIMQLIPYNSSYYKGQVDIVEAFQDFISRVVKYCVEEKDFECQQGYMDLLNTLHNRAPYNMQIELQSAIGHQAYSRVEIIKKILKQT